MTRTRGAKSPPPDGTTLKEIFASSGWQRGLLTQSETYEGSVKRKWTTLQWEQPCGGGVYQCNPRVTETNVYDDTNSDGNAENRRRVTTQYPTPEPTYNRPSTITEYDSNATSILRKTTFTYLSYINDNASYNLKNRVLGLPVQQCLYDKDNMLQAKTENFYDQGTLTVFGTTPIRHTNPNYTVGRGNLTTIRRYDINNATPNAENKIEYYNTGTPSCTKDADNHTTYINYDGQFLNDAGGNVANGNTYAYPTKITDPDGFSSTLIYHFDRGDVRRTIDPKGAQVRRDYDGMGRMWKVTNETNGAYARYNFDPNHNYVQSYSTINDATEFYSITTVDGHGRTRANASDHPGSTTNFKGQYTGYDNMGRVYQQSNPAEMNGSTWNPAGDDVAGWAWSYQTYDWQGRPLVTTNQDTTTKSISHDGCGCAGSQTMTIKDEGDGVLVGGQVRRRQQKLYHDVLGRVTKTQVLNWDSSVYSTTVNTYNVRDQITTVKEYSGNATGTEACPSTTCQKTDLSYDGHGRLSLRKLPIENTATAYTYAADDKILTMQDARGAKTIYGYAGYTNPDNTFSPNYRRLLSSISYDLSAANANDNVQVTPSVTFGYDAVGNRVWMKDGTQPTSGSQPAVAYAYDTLSRLQSETRRFNAFSSNTYELSYTYNLAGDLSELKYKMNSYPVDSSVSYAYNKAGQLLNVTGSGFGSVSQLTSIALPIKYRAWGAVKQMNYGNGLQTVQAYNARLQLTRRTFTPVSSAASDNDYAYYPDGRLKSRLLFSTPTDFDRLYVYDHAGRLTQGRTAGEARGLTGSGPYHQDYVYDVWNNLGRTNNTLWGYPQPTDAPTYTNNRHPGMFYDNAGNVTASGGISHTYDAASRQTYASGGGVVGGPPPQPIYPVWEIANNYDGNGQYVKRAETRRYPTPSGVTTTNYYVRSSVLGGAILVELNAQGNKSKSYVYAAGSRLAKHEPASAVAPVAWYITEPLTGDWGEAKSNGDFMGDRGANLDPLGADTPPNDPYLLDPTPTYIESRPNEPLYIDGGDPFDLSGGCTLDGVPVPCNFVRPLEQSDTAVNIPYGQATRFNPRTGGYETFSAFADGRQGYLPSTARFGDGGWYDPVSRTEGRLQKTANLPFFGFGVGIGGQRGGREPQTTPQPPPCRGIEGFSQGVGRFTANELNDAAITVFGELGAVVHPNTRNEARAVASEIFNRSDALLAGTGARIWGATASLSDVVSARSQFIGYREGMSILTNATIEFNEGDRNCTRLQSAIAAVTELANGSRPYNFLYNFSSYGGRRPLQAGETRMGGNDFSARDMGQWSPDRGWYRNPGWWPRR